MAHKLTRTSAIEVNWGTYLTMAPGDYAKESSQADATGRNTSVWTGGEQHLLKGNADYGGMNELGRNAGVRATVTFNMTSSFAAYDVPNFGAAAKGDFPYFDKAGGVPGVHRGHLLARCLGGKGDITNWVPLSQAANVASMWAKVEKPIFDWVRFTRGAYALLEIVPNYSAWSGPIPVSITYSYRVLSANQAQLLSGKEIIPNDVKQADFTATHQQNWKPPDGGSGGGGAGSSSSSAVAK